MTEPLSRTTLLVTLAATTATLGSVMLVTPGRVAGAVGGGQRPVRRGERIVIRLLGARMIGQAVLESVRPDRRTLTGAALVDATHAVSMIVLGWARPEYRPAARASALVASASGLLAGAAAARQRAVGSSPA
ncbi:MAG: hypothetical protein JO147_15475 [Actinobacteria bacterium]|nr:hypothetical protein [Actinomycetota bacterium]